MEVGSKTAGGCEIKCPPKSLCIPGYPHTRVPRFRRRVPPSQKVSRHHGMMARALGAGSDSTRGAWHGQSSDDE
eukprot:3657569-Rhodomonas_salina.2